MPFLVKQTFFAALHMLVLVLLLFLCTASSISALPPAASVVWIGADSPSSPLQGNCGRLLQQLYFDAYGEKPGALIELEIDDRANVIVRSRAPANFSIPATVEEALVRWQELQDNDIAKSERLMRRQLYFRRLQEDHLDLVQLLQVLLQSQQTRKRQEQSPPAPRDPITLFIDTLEQAGFP
jgi:hypothetical protein